MTRISQLLDEQRDLTEQLFASDIHTIEEALAELMTDDPSLTLLSAVAQLAEEEGVDKKRLWRALEAVWAEGPEVPLEESATRRIKHAAKRVRRGVRYVKNRYDRAKNSRRGRAVRRVVRGVRRAAQTNTGRSVAGAALSVVGI